MEKKISQPFLVSSAEAEGIPCDWSCLPSTSELTHPRLSHSREKQEPGFALPHVSLTFLEILNPQKLLLQAWSLLWETRAGKMSLCLHEASLVQLLIGTRAAWSIRVSSSQEKAPQEPNHSGVLSEPRRAELSFAGLGV